MGGHLIYDELLMSSADNFWKQFGPRSGQTYCRVWSGSKLFDTLMVLLIFFSEKDDFEKKSADDKTGWKLPRMQNLLL